MSFGTIGLVHVYRNGPRGGGRRLQRGRLLCGLHGDDHDPTRSREAHDHLHRLPQPRILLHGQACQQADLR